MQRTMADNLSDIQYFLFSTPAERQWQKIGVRSHTGLNIPLFSLHSEKSSGIGEFPDLIPMIDWCKELGMDIIQTLPLNDTGIDTSPYSAMTATALNPMHLGLSSLPELDAHPDLTASLNLIKRLNKTQRVQFQVLYQEREAFLQNYFERIYPLFHERQEYQEFVQKNAWIEEYALFKALKIKYQWASWEDWPADIRTPSPQTFNELLKEYESPIAYHTFIQFFCFQQMEHVKRYANAREIFIKGDIPILINRESADAWMNRTLFYIDVAAGAPPDIYSEEGQKWGFPIYNWDEMEKQEYRWWKVRLDVAARLYDIY